MLIGELTGPCEPKLIEAQVRRYRNQAAIARSWLSAEAPNLQLFLIGPPRALPVSRWRQMAAEVEVDERTCRKLVWLFDAAPGEVEATGFLGRTFVARPWPQTTERANLDAVATFSLLAGWEQLADKCDDYDELVAGMINSEAGE